jgi:hypothetical protein
MGKVFGYLKGLHATACACIGGPRSAGLCHSTAAGMTQIVGKPKLKLLFA